MHLYKEINYQSQKGATLLLFLLVLLSGSSYVLLNKLNAATNTSFRLESTNKSLSAAKQALIGYAVRYPEISGAVPASGPGYLPCPDLDNDGDAEGACALAGPVNRTTGRFPYVTLGVHEIKDGSGQRLWYALSDNFRNFNAANQIVNSDTPGQLNIDINLNGVIDPAADGDLDDIIAVIIAPGEPVTGQNRDPSETNIANEIANYLEADNNDFDVNFVNRGATVDTTVFNDEIITITRQELMDAVEKRVIREIQLGMNTYRSSTNPGAFPWLSPFADPSSTAFRGTLNTRQGHIPFHWSIDPVSINQGGAVADRNPFTTDISLSWNIANASVTNPGTTSYGAPSGYALYGGSMVTPSLNCTESSTCVDSNYPGNSPNGLDITSPIVFSNASCTWTSVDVFQCTGTFVNTIVNSSPQQIITVPSFAFSAGPDQYIYLRDEVETVIGEGGVYCFCWQTNVHTQYAYTETVTRTYTIDITYTDTSVDGADIQAPTAASLRTRDLTVDSNDVASALFNTGTTQITLTIEDDRETNTTLSDSSVFTRTANSTRTLTNDGDTTGSVAATGLLYDLDIDSDELPEWIVRNNWLDLIYVAYASGEAIPGDSTDVAPADGIPDNMCTAGANCINVTINGTVNNNIRAAIIATGQDLNAARPSAVLTDYLDDAENTDLDNSFTDNILTITYNDKTRIISTLAAP